MSKSQPKFKISLSEEQKNAKSGIYTNDVSIILGRQGSGKTQLACYTALDLFAKREIKKIIITRPIVSNKVGLLPGDISQKLEAWIQPIKQCMYALTEDVEKIDRLFEEKYIEILPIDFMKGVTFVNAFTIVDEFQDLTLDEFILALSRLGKNSKLMFTGSKEQVHHSVNKHSCIERVLRLSETDLVNFHTLTQNHRNDSIFPIIDYLTK